MRHFPKRILTREQLSRVLLMYGAFSVAGKMTAGNDRATMLHLRKLRAALKDAVRRNALERVIRNFSALLASERTPSRKAS